MSENQNPLDDMSHDELLKFLQATMNALIYQADFIRRGVERRERITLAEDLKKQVIDVINGNYNDVASLVAIDIALEMINSFVAFLRDEEEATNASP